MEAMVDTGSTFTWLPRPLLEGLGHVPRFRLSLRMADGRRVQRDATDDVPVRIGEAVRGVVCVFAEAGEQALLGATTLESHLLAADPVARRLVPVDALALQAVPPGRTW